MSLFIDTGVLLAFVNPRDAHHPEAREIVDRGTLGEWGRLVTSDFVFDEAVTLTLVRTRRVEAALRLGEFVLGTGGEGRAFDLAYVSPRLFLRAWSLFSRLVGKGLSFTDCTTLELMRSLHILEIASFDSDFDGLVLRRSSSES